MKRITLLLSLGLATMSATAAEAGDWNKGAGGIRDHGGLAGVPVPAPIPVMESFEWYLRADFGYAVKSTGSANISTALGLNDSYDYDRNEGPFVGGVGFGRYLTPKLRWDVVGDYRGAQKVKHGTQSYTGFTVTPGADVTVNTLDAFGNVISSYTTQSRQTNTFAIQRSEEVRVANHTGLFNLYYDFNRGSGFNPYVGAGLGIVIREGRVEYREVGECTSTLNSEGVPPGPRPCMQPRFDKSGKPTSVNFGLAAAFMAGATYEIRPGILLDTGYRFSWQGGNTSINTGAGDMIKAGERSDHEIRTGLRWNVW